MPLVVLLVPEGMVAVLIAAVNVAPVPAEPESAIVITGAI
jgi:hypothetical protein